MKLKSKGDSFITFLSGVALGAALTLIVAHVVTYLQTPREVLRNTAGAAPGATPPHVRGEMNAPVTLEEFGDFQCPPCAGFHPELKRVEAEYGSRLRVIFRHYPLAIHKHAREAARAAEAAALQNRFWEMHDLLYEKQDEWSEACDVRQQFIRYAGDLGLDVERFTKDMDSQEVNERVRLDEQRAESLDVPGTPSLFINGSQVPSAYMSASGIREQINAALKASSSK
jgi:protein-disulfide isomerase